MQKTAIKDVIEFDGAGPWQSKSGGELRVLTHQPNSSLMGIPFHLSERLFNYREDELSKASGDLRGTRMYWVRGIPSKTIGGTEFHRVREEMVFALDGEISWVCEDLSGEKKEWTLTPGKGIWMPPYILHTYTAIKDNSGLLVFCNTMFDPKDESMKDTYSLEEFKRLQME